jgi:mono/diheme cytochrome c family protein
MQRLFLAALGALAALAGPAGATPDPTRGQQFFTTTHGREWSCSSCHTARPTAPGRHAGTGKAIEPLAPAANPRRFSDAAKTEKWFRRNCNDVVGRECTADEKADVRAWLAALQP